jgi:hypothetical protein
VVIFFQIITIRPEDLKRSKIKNAVFVPMYDSTHWFHKKKLKVLTPYKFINFSSNLHERFNELQMTSIHVKYFNPPAKKVTFEQKNELSGFFWQRYDWINWNHISAIIKHAPFKRIHIHKAIDPPGYDFYPPSDEEMLKYNITISEWFEDPGEYFEILDRSDVFFSPRKHEGIGMSFIEAMARGKCVVAPDHPTMNEYIEHGKNGLLWNIEKLTPLNFDNIGDISKNAYDTVSRGYEKWLKDQGKILEFCEEPTLFWQGNNKTRSRVGLASALKRRVKILGYHINNRYPKVSKMISKFNKRNGLKP